MAKEIEKASRFYHGKAKKVLTPTNVAKPLGVRAGYGRRI